MNKTYIVAKREYLKVIKNKAFWFTTFAFPIFMVVIFVISGVSSQATEELAERLRAEENTVVVVDDSGLINKDIFGQLYIFEVDKDAVVEQVKSGEVDAMLYFPEDINNSELEIFIQDKGLFGNSRFDYEGQELLKQSILSNLPIDLLTLVNKLPESNITVYSEGEVVDVSMSRFVVPLVATVIYFTLTMFATSYLLMSVSEEKENRIIEIVLSTLSPRQLIWGKIIGQVGVVLTQVTILILLSILALIGLINLTGQSLPFDLSTISISPLQMITAIIVVIMSFLTIAGVMVGAGSVMPTYKDAQGLSSFFIILSIFPVYFFTVIIAEPEGTIARILSYVPLASGLILIFRISTDSISGFELLTSLLALCVYTYFSLVIAHKLFEIGSLEYGKRLGLKDLRRSS